MPAQWQKYPLKTQEEMAAGRRGILGYAIWQAADEGERWLREQFGKTLDFHTWANLDGRTVTLKVYNRPSPSAARGEVVFEVTEPASEFVSKVTVTKIILLA